MKKIFVLAVLAFIAFMPLCYALETVNADVNAETNPAGVTTSMNGNTSTNAGVPISSTAASAESRNTSGSGD